MLVRQGERLLLHATVLTAAGIGGHDHHEVTAPDAPDPEGLASLAERLPEDGTTFAFWQVVDARPTAWIEDWPPPEPLPPTVLEWMRLADGFDGAGDPWLDAARSLVFIDVIGWPAAHHHHAWRGEDLGWFAPSADLHVAFHQPAADEEWLLVEGAAPVSAGGLIGTEGRLWTRGGALVASMRSQLLWRPAPSGG